ncbi:short-chain dehydrogenase [Aspergillus sclerotioniger CBS 115572]|uniref:Short-chain dehydrogenase n=1 Tax=Aspergillus sclerotioniger CBS 115572 TaxID=1450535 RepID=A0A317WBS9_9EURO|nr:short-chain dehydrogenase [Aspergillus sclerotioniger CBS 115572]PWY81590.1 short-chain dehydrogenase [Aspergillus sclerotioniger CBS 115572]
METLKRIWPQIFPAKPTLTGATMFTQPGRVVIITGATSGLGRELAGLLYAAGATVYLGARNEAKAKQVIHDIISTTISTIPSPGTLIYLPLDLADLRTIQPFVSAFLASATRLDLLFNNAGVACIPLSQPTAQGLEPHLGTNCAGPYLLTRLLTPILTTTAQDPSTRPNSVRVIWSSSMVVDFLAPTGGVPPSELTTPNQDPNHNYAVSKVGNWFLAARMAKTLGEKGVISITQNPGNIYTPIYDLAPRLSVWLSKPIFYTPQEGVNTLLWAGFDEGITVEDGGRYGIPFGRWHPGPRQDLLEAMREGGTGEAEALDRWCEEVTREFC